jgi:uncharacterized protein
MQILVAAALAGLIATPHCAAMCGGFATACARPRTGLAAWHLGRLTTYGTLGALAGGLGGIVPGPAWLPAALAAALLVWFAAALAGLAPQPAVRLPWLTPAGRSLARRQGAAPRFLFGTVTGLLPCGMVYAALSIAIAAGRPLVGAAAMLAFGAATVPGLTVLSIGVQRLAARSLWTRRAVAALVLALGLWSVGLRGFGGHGLHASAAVAPAAQHVH